MMDFRINEYELNALYGLPHVQQLTYLRAVKPYMNIKTGMVGIDRGISYQSIAEQLFIEPHPGIKSLTLSRQQLRRAIAGLERAGLIQVQSSAHHLILKCSLATLDYSVRNKADTNPTYQVGNVQKEKPLENTRDLAGRKEKANTDERAKADIPHKENYYLFLLQQFEMFWSMFPNKKSKQHAWEVFQKLNPDEQFLDVIIKALNAQITHHEEQLLSGRWMPAWKYPANWLLQECWNDELPTVTEECSNAKSKDRVRKKSAIDLFCQSCEDTDFEFEDEPKAASNVRPFRHT
jgi:hypothetical protein